jgi:hypothetical protein
MNHLLKPASATIFFCLLSLPACSLFPSPQTGQEPASEENANQPKLVGRIANVSADGSFVIIQSYGPWDVPTNSTLASMGSDDRTANLRVSGEKQRQFAAADVRSGSVEVGDAVYTTLQL